MSAVFFEQVRAVLDQSGLSSWVEPGTDDEPFDQMHVLTAVDEYGRNFLLRLTRTSSQRAENSPSAKVESVEMALIFPFRVMETAYDDTARLLAATNLGLLIGTLGLVESDGVVMLRHAWHASSNDFTVGQAILLIDMLGYVSAEVAPLIEQVATGQLRYAQLQRSVCEAVEAEFSPSVNPLGVITV